MVRVEERGAGIDEATIAVGDGEGFVERVPGERGELPNLSSAHP